MALRIKELGQLLPFWTYRYTYVIVLPFDIGSKNGTFYDVVFGNASKSVILGSSSSISGVANFCHVSVECM